MATLEELLVAIGMETKDLTGGAEKASRDVEKSLGGIAAAGAGVAAGTAFAMAMDSAMDITAATTKLTNQLGLTSQEANRVGGLTGDVFAAGFGESIDQVSESIGAVIASVGDLGSTSDAELQQMTKDALGLADTFEFDVGESTQAVGTLIKAGLVKDGQAGFDLLTAAAQKLPPAMREELPALTNEYGEFFDQLGFTGPQMFGLLTEASKDPLFELDKLGDGLKEFSLRLADTKTVSQPLKDLGLDVKDIQKLVNTGQGTKAFDEVTTALRGVDDQTKRTSLQAALFGGPGEDMGNTLLKLHATGVDASSGMTQAAGSAKSVTDSMQSSPGQQFDSIMRTVSTTLGENLAPVLSAVAGFLSQHQELLSILTPIILAVAVALGIWAVVQWALNVAMFASPVTWIILAIVALVATIVVIATKTQWFQIAWAAVWAVVWGAIKAVGEWITGTLWPWIRDTWGKIAGAAGDMKDKIIDGWNAVMDFVTGLPGKISSAASGMWDGIWNAFKSAINWIIGAWNGLSFGIPAIDIPGLGTVGGGTFSVPQIPMLADGGIATSPTLAMIGEGQQKEAVLPLDRLDSMLGSTAGAVARTGGQSEQRLVIDVTGADSDFKKLVRRMVRIDGRGSPATAFAQ